MNDLCHLVCPTMNASDERRAVKGDQPAGEGRRVVVIKKTRVNDGNDLNLLGILKPGALGLFYSSYRI